MTAGSNVAFVGLGVMGYPMAGHLKAAGHRVVAYNRTATRARAWQEKHAGEIAPTPRLAAEGASFVFVCVGNDDDVRSVVYGDDGVLAGMARGATLVDHTTTSAELARELAAACAERGIGFLDAPLSGGQAGAENGVLTSMVGGSEATFEAASPVIAAYARTCVRIGDAGAGQLAKMVNQICIAGVVQGLAEAISFGMRADLDMERVMAAISKGAAQSWQMENRWKTMVDNKFDFGFAVDWMRKDLGFALQEARRNGARLPLTALVDQFYAHVQTRGGGKWDTSSLIEPLNRK